MNSPEEVSNYISEAIKDRSFDNVAKGGDVGGFILNDMEGVILEALQVLQSQGLFIGRWRPIEEAPKDGKTVRVCGGTYCLPNHEGQLQGAMDARWNGSEWVGDSSYDGDHYILEPTYFMNLPTPPKGGE